MVLSPASYESGKAEHNALKHGKGLTAGKWGRLEGLLLAIQSRVDGIVNNELGDDLFHLANCGHVVVLTADGDEFVDVATGFLEVVLADGGDADLLVERTACKPPAGWSCPCIYACLTTPGPSIQLAEPPLA